jgi:hypothetical protein
MDSPRPGQVETLEQPGVVGIETLVVVEWFGRVERIEQFEPLASFHDWTEATILGRFRYRTPGLWALAVRAYRRAQPWPVAITPAHLGCKTWVPLESPPSTSGLVPVLGSEEACGIVHRIRSALTAEVAVGPEAV